MCGIGYLSRDSEPYEILLSQWTILRTFYRLLSMIQFVFKKLTIHKKCKISRLNIAVERQNACAGRCEEAYWTIVNILQKWK